MGLTNVIDGRKHRYRFEKINAVIEPTCHDNSIQDADKATTEYPDIGYDQREHITVSAAFAWANTFAYPVTLYLYDHDGGIYPVDLAEGWDRDEYDKINRAPL